MQKSRYTSNSPSYRKAKSELIAWLVIFGFFTILVVAALWLTGGIY